MHSRNVSFADWLPTGCWRARDRTATATQTFAAICDFANVHYRFMKRLTNRFGPEKPV
jgi:hypothetical protein